MLIGNGRFRKRGIHFINFYYIVTFLFTKTMLWYKAIPSFIAAYSFEETKSNGNLTQELTAVTSMLKESSRAIEERRYCTSKISEVSWIVGFTDHCLFQEYLFERLTFLFLDAAFSLSDPFGAYSNAALERGHPRRSFSLLVGVLLLCPPCLWLCVSGNPNEMFRSNRRPCQAYLLHLRKDAQGYRKSLDLK